MAIFASFVSFLILRIFQRDKSYKYIYIHTHTHTHIYIYIYTYISLYARQLSFLSPLNFLDRLKKYTIMTFRENPSSGSLGSQCCWTDRWKDRQANRHDKTNMRFSQCCKKHLQLNTANLMSWWIRVIRRCRQSSCSSSWGGNLNSCQCEVTISRTNTLTQAHAQGRNIF